MTPAPQALHAGRRAPSSRTGMAMAVEAATLARTISKTAHG